MTFVPFIQGCAFDQVVKAKPVVYSKMGGPTKVTTSVSQTKSIEKEVEEMEVALKATQLAHVSVPIDDIDSADSDNPQLCAEYVKDIYQYMRELEVMTTYL